MGNILIGKIKWLIKNRINENLFYDDKIIYA